MPSTGKILHPKFIEYMWSIIDHPNYQGLAIETKNAMPGWVTTAKTKIGQERKDWAEKKAAVLGIPLLPGAYAKVMYMVHPTKNKVCQICGESMSISYIYPSATFAKAIVKEFDIDIDVYDSIYEIWTKISNSGQDIGEFIKLINTKFDTNFKVNDNMEHILKRCEYLCRVGGKAQLSPGAMSNFPDRFDGFHSYNRCHRTLEDKGRSKENMKTYTRDRRAYEYWSDGNIQAANQFMGSPHFKGVSADHVGPISLGFIHDSHYLRRMSGSDNSSKRDRLTADIIEEILLIQKMTNVYPMSWYSSVIWNYIVNNYHKNPDKVSGQYRNLLKQNMSNYMHIMKTVIDSGDHGIDFLVQSLINPKKNDFKSNYTFDEFGNITARVHRNITQGAKGEFERFARIALAAINDYNEKDNRHISQNLTNKEQSHLLKISHLVSKSDYVAALIGLRKLIDKVQKRLISGE